ncbi:MAG: cytochrome c3 family protein [Verrucomicrobia bacterium]|nr:cytochrome c3 family protein [Verrucomicrobiota bacterium]MCF7708082.1 cytochrome c3 family protein [Verrucomicrobiota bacterium]
MIVSCGTVNRVAFIPPQIPGATYVGSSACSQCHGDLYDTFIQTATHARLQAEGENAINMGCESCHGPGSLHIEAFGEKKPPTNYRPGDPKVSSGSQRQTIVNPRRTPENCFSCHLDKRAEFELPTHHQVREGKMSCGDCHHPHEGPAVEGRGTTLASENETCFECHISQRGPFVFEHEAVREGCTTCHNTHGSVNPKMLRTRNQNLCLKCHFQRQTAPGRIYIGGRDHSAFVSRGTCWTAGCHEAVHGSHVSPSLRY